MTAQVVFLNTFYYPNEIERARLNFLQEQMSLYHAELEYLTRDFDKYKKYVFKESSHRNLRATWVLYVNEGIKTG